LNGIVVGHSRKLATRLKDGMDRCGFYIGGMRPFRMAPAQLCLVGFTRGTIEEGPVTAKLCVWPSDVTALIFGL
jgi:hypothetical protein